MSHKLLLVKKRKKTPGASNCKMGQFWGLKSSDMNLGSQNLVIVKLIGLKSSN
jgi:hypothetical protein